MAEVVVLDPVEIAADRTEFDITHLVREDGIDWGDASIEAYQAQAQRGMIPVDHRVPNRTIQIPFTPGLWDADDFESDRASIQAKAALFQNEGGWLKRETAIGPVYADVVSATLKLGGGRAQALWEIDADAVLTLEAIPDFYGDEVPLGDHSEATLPELVFTETDISGDYPGRVRIVVDEDDGESQLGLIWGIRSKHYDAGSTARLAYQAEALTPLDTAAATALTGASGSGSNTVRHNNLATSWTPVLSTQASGGGAHMSHAGTYRVWARVYSTSGDDVQLRLLWDVGDLALPVENAPKRIPGASNFYHVDLGEIRLDKAPVGTHRWQGVIQGKGDAGGENVSIDRVYIVPVDEGYGVLRSPVSAEQGLADFVARDEFNQTAGALTGKTLPVGGMWAGAGDADDFAVETTGKTAQRTAVSDAAGVNTGRFAIAGTTTFTGVVTQVDLKMSSNISAFALVARYIDVSNWAMACFFLPPQHISPTLRVCAAGVVTDFAVVDSWVGPSSFDTWQTARLVIDAAGRAFAWLFPTGSVPGFPLVVGQHSALATGGALASGKSGFYDFQFEATASTRNYNNFAAWVPTTDAVLHPNQSAELRSDGHIREDSAGAAYGPVSHVIGDLPRLPSAGLEDRTCELFLKASRGDFDQLPDSGIDDLSARVHYRPSHLFVPNS